MKRLWFSWSQSGVFLPEDAADGERLSDPRSLLSAPSPGPPRPVLGPRVPQVSPSPLRSLKSVNVTELNQDLSQNQNFVVLKLKVLFVSGCLERRC